MGYTLHGLVNVICMRIQIRMEIEIQVQHSVSRREQ